MRTTFANFRANDTVQTRFYIDKLVADYFLISHYYFGIDFTWDNDSSCALNLLLSSSLLTRTVLWLLSFARPREWLVPLAYTQFHLLRLYALLGYTVFLSGEKVLLFFRYTFLVYVSVHILQMSTWMCKYVVITLIGLHYIDWKYQENPLPWWHLWLYAMSVFLRNVKAVRGSTLPSVSTLSLCNQSCCGKLIPIVSRLSVPLLYRGYMIRESIL